MTRLRRWFSGFWDALGDFLEGLGDIDDDFLD
jgi:hypothetical protein